MWDDKLLVVEDQEQRRSMKASLQRNGRKAVVALAAGICMAFPGGAAQEPMSIPQVGKAVEAAIRRVFPALVRIHVVLVDPDSGRLQKFEGAGSGAIISKEGHVLTNHHVAGKAKRLLCRLWDGEEIEATFVGTDAMADICIIKLNLDARRNKEKTLAVAVFGDSDKLRLGDTVFAMGCPVSLSQSVTKGIVSNTAMIMPSLWWFEKFTMDGEDVGGLVRWIGHDAAIYPGNSGGPLVNERGEIVGVNEIGMGLSGAIPGNVAKSVADQIIRQGGVKRSWTGLDCQPRLKDSPQGKGILVSGVIGNSPAAKAGIKPGDVITSFDGVSVNCTIPEEQPLFNQLVLSTPIGKDAKVTFLRDKEEKTATLTTEGGSGRAGRTRNCGRGASQRGTSRGCPRWNVGGRTSRASWSRRFGRGVPPPRQSRRFDRRM